MYSVFVPVLKNTVREIFRDFIEGNNAHEIMEDEIYYVTINRNGHKSSELVGLTPTVAMGALTVSDRRGGDLTFITATADS